MLSVTRAFPPFLRGVFAVEDLSASRATIAVIDPAGNILWVNAAWHDFARRNGAGPAADSWASYFAAIAPPLCDYYRAAFANALATGDVFEQEYECSSGDELRRFHLRAMPIAGHGLVVEHSLLVAQPHELGSEDADEAAYRRDDGLVLQCSNCRRVRRAREPVWDWVPSLVVRQAQSVSHGICKSCVGFYFGDWREKNAATG